MISHQPKGYVCPICQGIAGVEDDSTLIVQSDILFRNDEIIVFLNSFFIGNNPGSIVISPVRHVENIYAMRDGELASVMAMAKRMALIIRTAYDAKGVMVLQNNEPASDQHAFHFHLHLFARFDNDNLHLNLSRKRVASTLEKQTYLEKLRLVMKTTQ